MNELTSHRHSFKRSWYHESFPVNSHLLFQTVKVFSLECFAIYGSAPNGTTLATYVTVKYSTFTCLFVKKNILHSPVYLLRKMFYIHLFIC